MSQKDVPRHGSAPSGRTAENSSHSPDASAPRLLALGLEVARRVAELESLEEVYFFLVNDLRVLVEFDRGFLITHLGGRSGFVAAGNQPTLEKKSKVYEAVDELGPLLRGQKRALLLSRAMEETDPGFEDLSADLRTALKDYLAFSGCTFLFLVPLIHVDVPVAHILLEFIDAPAPNQAQVVALLHGAPVFASVLTERWLLHQRPGLAGLITPKLHARGRALLFLRRHLAWIALLVILPTVLLFAVPVGHTVGGEAEITPWERRLAFCQMDGLIETVNVSEGSPVDRGQVLATLDPTELDYRIESSRREHETLTKQAALLGLESDQTPSKLAEARILELKKAKIENDLKFLLWQKQFLEIRAPSTGIVITRDVEGLAGKKLKAGEAFCELAVPGELGVDVFVPEDRVTGLKPGQDLYVYLNSDPPTGYKLKIELVSPVAEAIPRLGNVCKVRGRFPDAPESAKPGMNVVGKINIDSMNFWSIITQRLAVRWNQFSLRF